MTVMLRAVLLAALASAFIPAVAAGQSATTDDLLRRIAILEGRINELEERVRTLESLVKVEPSGDRPVLAAPNWRELQNWRRLQRGMTMNQVRALLGEPQRVDAGVITYWRWAEANVHFIDGRLEGWSEPRR